MGYLVKYSDFYGTAVPDNPIELILDIPKEELIATVVAVNTRLKPLTSNHFDDSKDTQINCLRAIFLDDKRSIDQSFSLSIIKEYSLRPANHKLFSRVTCLYALQEIINCEQFTYEIPEYNFDNRERIFKFLLIANDQILTGDKNYKEEGYEKLGNDFFEFFMYRELHHNQYNECSNAFNIFYKSRYLFNKIENHHLFGEHFKNYITWHYNVESSNKFLVHIVLSYINSNDDKLGLRYLNVPIDNTDAIKILDAFSSKVVYDIPEKGDLKTFDFFPLKKCPLFKCKQKDDKDIISYLLLDESFYIEKAYSIFINDFWFDYLEPNKICTRKDWGNFIGSEFYEPFIEEILNESFSTNQNIVLRSTNQLIFNFEGSPIEYADFYIREKQNIALIEAKSAYLPIVNGYKTVATIDDFRNLNLDEFYKDYGLVQLASKTIKKFHSYKNHIKDLQFNASRKVHLYPVLIVNDPIFSSSMSLFIFKRKFNDLLEKEGINKKSKDHNISDLCIINVSHLQEMEQSLKDKKVNFFSLLDLCLLMSDFKNKNNFKEYKFLRTFEQVLYAKVKDGLISDRITDLKWLKE